MRTYGGPSRGTIRIYLDASCYVKKARSQGRLPGGETRPGCHPDMPQAMAGRVVGPARVKSTLGSPVSGLQNQPVPAAERDLICTSHPSRGASAARCQRGWLQSIPSLWRSGARRNFRHVAVQPLELHSCEAAHSCSRCSRCSRRLIRCRPACVPARPSRMPPNGSRALTARSRDSPRRRQAKRQRQSLLRPAPERRWRPVLRGCPVVRGPQLL